MTLSEALIKIAKLEDDLAKVIADRELMFGGTPASVKFRLPGAENIILTPGQKRIVHMMYLRTPNFIERESLLNSFISVKSAASKAYFPQNKMLGVVVCRIRKKLKGTPWTLETEWGFGYRLIHSTASISSVGTLGNNFSTDERRSSI